MSSTIFEEDLTSSISSANYTSLTPFEVSDFMGQTETPRRMSEDVRKRCTDLRARHQEWARRNIRKLDQIIQSTK